MFTQKKLEKPNIKLEISKAIYILSSNKPEVTVGLSFIVQQVQQQIRGLKNFPRSDKSRENLIKTTINSMRKNGEIGYRGRNKYSMGVQQIDEAVGDGYGDGEKNIEKVPPEYFQVPSAKQKNLPETAATSLHPAKKRRNESDLSSNSLSGDEFQQVLKQFHGLKKMERKNYKPNLPKARQVLTGTTTAEIEEDLPGISQQLLRETKPQLSKVNNDHGNDDDDDDDDESVVDEGCLTQENMEKLPTTTPSRKRKVSTETETTNSINQPLKKFCREEDLSYLPGTSQQILFVDCETRSMSSSKTVIDELGNIEISDNSEPITDEEEIDANIISESDEDSNRADEDSDEDDESYEYVNDDYGDSGGDGGGGDTLNDDNDVENEIAVGVQNDFSLENSE